VVAADEREEYQFQSTLPVWGATWTDLGETDDGVFQSTLPVWGATPLCSPPPNHYIGFNPRSPCGERLYNALLKRVLDGFNPRSPCGERLQSLLR